MAYHQSKIMQFLEGQRLSRKMKAGIEGRLFLTANQAGFVANLDLNQVFEDKELEQRFLESLDKSPDLSEDPLD